MAYEISKSEEIVVRAIEQGNAIHGTHTLRSSTLRQILLGLSFRMPGSDQEHRIQVRETGIVLSNITFDGLLDLSDARSLGGSPLPPLFLESCIFNDPVKLSGAHFRKLSFQQSALIHLEGTGLVVDGSLDISALRSSEDYARVSGVFGHPRCSIALHQATIKGDLYLSSSRFVASNSSSSESGETVSFDLTLATIGGNVEAIDVAFLGGLDMTASRVDGTVGFSGSTFAAKDLYGFRADRAEVRADLYLDPYVFPDGVTSRTRIAGMVSLEGCKIGSRLLVDGLSLTGNLIATNLYVAGRCSFGSVSGTKKTESGELKSDIFSFNISGLFDLANARVEGDFNMSGAQLSSEYHSLILRADRLEVSGKASFDSFKIETAEYVLVQRFRARGTVSLAGARFHSNLEMDGALIEASGQDDSLYAPGMEVRRDLQLKAERPFAQGIQRFVAIGKVNLQGIHVHGNLIFDGALLLRTHSTRRDPAPSGTALNCSNAVVDGDIRFGLQEGSLRGLLHTFYFCSQGTLDFSGTIVGGSVDLRGAKVHAAPTSEAVILNGTIIKNSLFMAIAFGFRLGDQSGIRFRCRGKIAVIASEIKTDFALRDAILIADSGEVLYVLASRVGILDMTFAKIWGSSEFFETNFQRFSANDLDVVAGSFALIDCTVRSTVELSRVTFDPSSMQNDKNILVFDNCKFEGLLKLFPTLDEGVWLSEEKAKHPPCRFGISLKNLDVGELSMSDEVSWDRRFKISLDGFHYDRITPWDAARLVDWLQLQYEDAIPKKSEFFPHVYDRLATALRGDGDDEGAKEALIAKLNIRRQLKPNAAARFFWYLYHKCFRYGLSAKRAFITMGLGILFGATATAAADYGIPQFGIAPVMVVETSSVNTVVSGKEQAGIEMAEEGKEVIDELPCGSKIDPFLYATNLFIPALDLHQTELCTISEKPRARGWVYARSAYSIFGWIATSITLLTIPGILQKRAEE